MRTRKDCSKSVTTALTACPMSLIFRTVRICILYCPFGSGAKSKRRRKSYAMDQFDCPPGSTHKGNAARRDGQAYRRPDVLGKNPRYHGGPQEDERLGL